jgi:hypothetical protein
MFERASKKLGLDQARQLSLSVSLSLSLRLTPFQAVFSTFGATAVEARDKEEINSLLRHGAYALLDDADDAAREFQEQDIDQILSKRAHRVQYEDGAATGASACIALCLSRMKS